MTQQEWLAHEPRLVFKKNPGPPIRLGSPSAINEFIRKKLTTDMILSQEFGGVITLNRNLNVILHSILFKGGLSACIMDPTLILKYVIDSLAKSVIIYHNHPSGNLCPSVEDKNLTSSVKKLCEATKIDFLDHIIITENNYFSFKQEDLL